MKKLVLGMVVVGMLGMSGCGGQKAETAGGDTAVNVSDQGVNVQTGNADVNVGDQGVNVNAGGTAVNVNTETGQVEVNTGASK